MLSPQITVAEGLITDSFNQALSIDSYSLKSQSLLIGKLPEDPQWLVSVRNRVEMLSKAGAAWTQEKPEIWGPVLLQFADYSSAFAGVAEMKKAGALKTQKQWIEVLEQTLLPELRKAATTTEESAGKFRTRLQAFRSVQPLLEESIREGWLELHNEERAMTEIAAQLAHLQDVVSSLEESISSTQISSGQSIVQNTVKTVYEIAIEVSVSFSFLSMAASVYTVGKTFYSIISGIAEISETLDKIGELQLKASNQAQAAAATKMVLQLVYDLELSFARIVETLPRLTTMWRTELEKVKSVIGALEAGVEPGDYVDLVTFSVANANWQQINSLVQAIVTVKTKEGPPVLLDPQKPMALQG
ncbi:MAG: alpha-pore-forming cytotoxin subunit MakB [Solirubrobacterales bacterium]